MTGNRPTHPGKRLPEEERKKVMVVCDHDIADTDWLAARLDKLLINFDDPVILLDPECAASKYIMEWAAWNWYVFKLYHFHRSRNATDHEWVRDADLAVVFHDGANLRTGQALTVVRNALPANKVRVIKV